MMNKPFTVFGKHDDMTLEQMRQTMEHPSAVYGAIMADGHAGYSMPIGGVAAYDNAVNIAGVGVDIACGICALRTDATLDNLKVPLYQMGQWIQNNIGSGQSASGQKNKLRYAPTNHPLFEDDAWGLIPREYRSELMAKARNQLGTIGGGNHFIDLLIDEEGFIWIAAHFGSRKFGYTIANSFIAISQGKDWGGKGNEKEPSVLSLDSIAGKDYFDLMHLAGKYAYAGREWVCNTVARVMGAGIKHRVHNHHNFAWKEKHFGRDLIVVRKGATPAWGGQEGFVGGSMGDDAVILEGASAWTEDHFWALFSTVHGAGRARSRNETRGKIDRKRGIIKSPGMFSVEDVQKWLDSADVTVFGGDIDEGPQAYKRLSEVLPHQRATISINHTLKPLVVVMASGYSGKNPFIKE